MIGARTVIGPNCAGIVCTSHKLFPTLEIHPPRGGVALISQSGALGGVVLAPLGAKLIDIGRRIAETKVERPLAAKLQRKAGKVEFINPGIAPDLAEELLSLVQCASPEDDQEQQ